MASTRALSPVASALAASPALAAAAVLRASTVPVIGPALAAVAATRALSTGAAEAVAAAAAAFLQAVLPGTEPNVLMREPELDPAVLSVMPLLPARCVASDTLG